MPGKGVHVAEVCGEERHPAGRGRGGDDRVESLRSRERACGPRRSRSARLRQESQYATVAREGVVDASQGVGPAVYPLVGTLPAWRADTHALVRTGRETASQRGSRASPRRDQPACQACDRLPACKGLLRRSIMGLYGRSSISEVGGHGMGRTDPARAAVWCFTDERP
jgi:hypothetical protein